MGRGLDFSLAQKALGSGRGRGRREQVAGDRNQPELKFQNKTMKLLLSPGVWI